jgi:hypothetical protein
MRKQSLLPGPKRSKRFLTKYTPITQCSGVVFAIRINHEKYKNICSLAEEHLKQLEPCGNPYLCLDLPRYNSANPDLSHDLFPLREVTRHTW